MRCISYINMMDTYSVYLISMLRKNFFSWLLRQSFHSIKDLHLLLIFYSGETISISSRESHFYLYFFFVHYSSRMLLICCTWLCANKCWIIILFQIQCLDHISVTKVAKYVAFVWKEQSPGKLPLVNLFSTETWIATYWNLQEECSGELDMEIKESLHTHMRESHTRDES